jgi:hypothetical protein
MAVTQEALCFVEHYPQRKDELIRRIKEGRAYVSPYLCNSLWAFQSVESALRTFYPARRLEREWGIAIDVAEHIEEPSLPWGMAPILAGCGIRWLSNPYYPYDSTFRGLKNPPLFVHEGPDGSRVRVVMDPWACNSYSYTQGRHLLKNARGSAGGWASHYAKLGSAYGTRAILASGTHGDISPSSGSQARGFAEAIIRYNRERGDGPVLMNAALPQFCAAVDESERRKPFLQTIRGCFGHAWDVWPVCLAKYAAGMREGGRAFLAAESLLALAMARKPALLEATRRDRERAEWCWAMLADHAWNGTGDGNKRHNADLRRAWSQELAALARKLQHQAWTGLGLQAREDRCAVFNPLSFPRRDLLRIEGPVEGDLLAQRVDEQGTPVLYLLSPEIPAFGVTTVESSAARPASKALHASPTSLESPFYKLTLDPANGGVASLTHKATGRELVAGGTLCRTVYHDGKERPVSDVRSEVAALGPVLARLRVTGRTGSVSFTNLVTVYAELDRVDFDCRVSRPAGRKQERLCHVFPIVRDGTVLRIDATGAVVRPYPQPKGDLLPGADTRRFAVQGFVDASVPGGPGVTIATRDAFVLRTDLGQVTLEALGNDQNYREVVQDQHGVREFRFRYSLRAHTGDYDGAAAFAWSRSVLNPLVAVRGQVRETQMGVSVDPARAVATCLKPADDPEAGGVILRLRETSGASGPLTVMVGAAAKVSRTDLLERDQQALPIRDGAVEPGLHGHGFAALRLAR